MSQGARRVALVVDPAAVPDGRQVRRLTARIQDARLGRGLAGVVTEIWYTVVTVGLCLALVTGIAGSVHDAAPADARAADALLSAGELPALLLVVAAAGGLLSLAGRLGPVGLGGGGSAWWLPMPVRRRGLLGPTVLRWPAVYAGVGALAAPTIVFALFGAPATLGGVLAWAAVGGAGVALLGAAAAALQSWRGAQGSRLTAVVGEVTMLASAVGVAVLAWGALAAPRWSLTAGAAAWVAAGVVLCAAVAATWWSHRRVERLSGAVLRAQGSVGDRAQVAVLSLDLRELGRALTVGSLRSRRRGSWSMAAGGPRRALVLADVALLARTPRTVAQVVVAALVAVTAQRVVLTSTGLALYVALVATGFWASNAAAGGARQAEMAPVLDRLLPLSARHTRVLRGTVPLLAAGLWALVGLGALALTDDAGWLAVAPAWALVLAAAAVRSAYRPAPRAARVVSSPMGGVPPVGGLLAGLDVALVGTLPTAVALYLGTLGPVVIATQWALALALVASLTAASGRRPPTSAPVPASAGSRRS